MNNDFYVYDIESYPNVFTCTLHRPSHGHWWVYKITDYENQWLQLVNFLYFIRDSGGRMVGFNNVGYDYPVLHYGLSQFPGGNPTAWDFFDATRTIIEHSESDEARQLWVPEWKRVIPQVDLYMIHHFNNKSRRTSLKALEFNMRSHSVEDLPFVPGTMLYGEQIEKLIQYNAHDVSETARFLTKTLPMIEFRDQLSEKYGRDFTNFNDTKIGKEYFIQKLEEARPGSCYVTGTREPVQTWRSEINLAEAVSPKISFRHPEFERIRRYLQSRVITETKGVFDNLSATVNGFKFVFGVGGIHGSVSPQIVTSDGDGAIIDIDVTSYYPSLAIVNRFFPQHLGELFCDIYAELKKDRVNYPKGSPENAMLKLALNGVYGDSNNVYSPFYDPLYMMKITINGQLFLCMLAEMLMAGIPNLRLLQINTDGMTVKVPYADVEAFANIKASWQRYTGLDLEEVYYRRMFIRDVNNYIAEKYDGSLKRKGAYQFEDLEWHKNQSALVVAKAAEAALVRDEDIREFITRHHDIYDFMLCVKATGKSYLKLQMENGGEQRQQKTTRYYVAHTGRTLVKMMPPIQSSKGQWRPINVEAGWNVQVCNNIMDACAPINYEYYIAEAAKLVDTMKGLL